MPDIDSTLPAVMTTKEWLQRIEGGLTRIEDKLDTKADKAALDSLESRLRLIESLGTEQSRRSEADIRTLSKDVTNMKVKVYAILGGVAILASVLEVLRQGGLLG